MVFKNKQGQVKQGRQPVKHGEKDRWNIVSNRWNTVKQKVFLKQSKSPMHQLLLSECLSTRMAQQLTASRSHRDIIAISMSQTTRNSSEERLISRPLTDSWLSDQSQAGWRSRKNIFSLTCRISGVHHIFMAIQNTFTLRLNVQRHRSWYFSRTVLEWLPRSRKTSYQTDSNSVTVRSQSICKVESTIHFSLRLAARIGSPHRSKGAILVARTSLPMHDAALYCTFSVQDLPELQ